MDIKNIDINKIKVAIFDFDDTLAIHKDKEYSFHRKENEEKRLGYYLNAYKNPGDFYDIIEPCQKSELLYDLICELRRKNVKIYCLSGMKFSFHLKAKQSFINKHYGEDIEVIAAGSQELKLDGVKIIAKYFNYSLNEILFVDDREDIVKLMTSNGVKSFLVTDLTD